MSFPLCMDCMYFIHAGDKCARSEGTPDYLRGHKPTPRSARVERCADLPEACGPQAKFFRIIPVAAAA